MNKKLKEFETLVVKHHRLVLGFAISLVGDVHTAKDLTQEALLTAFFKLDKFDKERDFGNWVRGIVRFKYLEHCRKNKDILMEDDLIDLIASQYDNWSRNKEVNGQDIHTSLNACLSKLDKTSFTIIDKFYFKKIRCTAIAQQCNLRETTVRKRLERIRKELKDCIEQGEYHER